jgi:phospholipase C
MAKTALSWSVGDDGLTLAIPKAWDDVRVVRQRPGAKPGPAEPLHPGQHRWALNDSLGWYDVTLTRATDPDYRRRLTGRHDRPGRATVSDPFIA